MKIIKRLIIIAIIIITIIIITLLFLNNNQKKNNELTGANNISNEDNIIVTNPNLEKEITIDTSNNTVEVMNNRNEYYAVKNILASTTNNNYIIHEMYMLKKTVNIDIVWIIGIVKDSGIQENIIVITDSLNNTYLVFNEEIINQNGYTLETLNNINIETIEKSENNSFNYKNISDEEYAKDLLKDYLEKALYSPSWAYNYYLNEEYREKKFGSLENYADFIEQNRNTLNLYDAKNIRQYGEFGSYEEWLEYFSRVKPLELEKYAINKRDGYTEYTVIDTYGNYYIFNVESVMNYKVILDTYTVDIPEFLEKYNDADDEQKAEMNMNRFLEALEERDYKYLYSKLSNEFKASYFPSEAYFQEYAMQNLLEYENIDDIDLEEQDGKYNCLLETVTSNNQTMQKEFIIELGQDAQYWIEFTI